MLEFTKKKRLYILKPLTVKRNAFILKPLRVKSITFFLPLIDLLILIHYYSKIGLEDFTQTNGMTYY